MISKASAKASFLTHFSLTDLKTYCDKHKIKYTLFKDWTVVKAMVEKVSHMHCNSLSIISNTRLLFFHRSSRERSPWSLSARPRHEVLVLQMLLLLWSWI
jgi:hypothetical protein